MKNYDYKISSLESELKSLKGELANAKKFTQKFLNKCEESGITRVSVGTRSKRVPRTVDWPFGVSGSVFQHPADARGKNGYVAIWSVVEELGISGGAGNSAQHQVSNENLIEGVFELKGKDWIKTV